MDPLQSQHGKPDSPQAEAANSRLVAGNQQSERKRIAQVRMRHADQFAHRGVKAGIRLAGAQRLQLEAVAGEHVLREPARSAAAILPDILQDVGHLQALSEGHVQLVQGAAALADLRGVGAEQLREHLPDDAGDVVAIVVQVARGRQAAQARGLLELVHPAAHQLDATLDGEPLLLTQGAGHAHHPAHVQGQIPLGRQSSLRQGW